MAKLFDAIMALKALPSFAAGAERGAFRIQQCV